MAQTDSGSYPNDGPHPGDAAYPSGGTYPGGTGHPGGIYPGGGTYPGGFYPGGGTYPSGPAYGGYPEYSAGAAGPYGVVMGPGPAPRRKMNGIEIVSLLAAAVIALGAAVVCSFLSVGLAFATDSCSATECSDAAATSFMGNALAQFAVVVLVIVCLALYRTSVKIRVGIMLGGAVLSVVALVLAYWYAASIIDGHS